MVCISLYLDLNNMGKRSSLLARWFSNNLVPSIGKQFKRQQSFAKARSWKIPSPPKKKMAISILTSINEQQINCKISGLVLHVCRKGNKIPPICTIILFLDMTFKPAVRVGLGTLILELDLNNKTDSMQNVQLTPFQRGFRADGCIGGSRLHSTNEALVNNLR